MILKALFNFLIFPGFLFMVLFGLFLTWIDRKVTARIQWRKGPPIYQPYADALKLLLKETLVPNGAPKFLFLFSPLLGLVGVIIAGVILLSSQFSFTGDLIVIIYLFALPPIAIIIGGSSSKNPLSAVGASREMTLYFGYELPFLLALLVPVIKSGSIKISQILLYQENFGPILYSLSGVLAFIIALFSVQAKLGFVPFDIPEAEQEIMAGPLLEYSGVSLLFFKLMRAALLFLLPIFLIILFWGGIKTPWVILKFLFILVLLILLKNTNPRLRIDQALKFFWIILGLLGVVAVILAFNRL
ncbi:MAG: complex I subunit 1 family protein [candidate division WOR-3 bacterium]